MFTNQSAYNSALSYDLVISPDITTIVSGDSFDFFAESIDAQEGLDIGTMFTYDLLTLANGYEFGTYNDNPISWRVLSIDVDNNRALLIMKQALPKKAYNDTRTSATWETCTARFTTADGEDLLEGMDVTIEGPSNNKNH